MKGLKGVGFMVQAVGYRTWGAGLRVFRAWVNGLGFRVRRMVGHSRADTPGGVWEGAA